MSEYASSPSPARAYGLINLTVLLGQIVGWAGLVSAMHMLTSWPVRIAVLVLFCTMMQGIFSMMHECYHGLGHSHPVVNGAMSFVASTIFGTSATLFCVNHLGHHVRNRTRAELAEYIFPDESPLKKRVLYYLAITGGIWMLALVGSLALTLLPIGWVYRMAQDTRGNTYFAAFRDFSATELRRVRWETIGAIALWAIVAGLLDWRLTELAWIYAGFAFSWSSLQWVYHMRTPIDVVEGAYNLRLPTLLRWLFLNFNYNLSHHRYPSVHWQDLYRRSDPAETRPLWFNYLAVFRVPEPLPADPSVIRKTYF